MPLVVMLRDQVSRALVGGLSATYYSSSTSFGKCRVQSSSLKQIGRPRRMDIDLSANSDVRYRIAGMREERILTSKEEPECPATHFALYRIQSFVGRLIMHMQSHRNMCCFAKRCVRCCVMTLTEVIYGITFTESVQ